MKYYLVRENIVGNEEDLGNCLITIDKRIEITEKELKSIFAKFYFGVRDDDKMLEKIRKALE